MGKHKNSTNPQPYQPPTDGRRLCRASSAQPAPPKGGACVEAALRTGPSEPLETEVYHHPSEKEHHVCFGTVSRSFHRLRSLLYSAGSIEVQDCVADLHSISTSSGSEVSSSDARVRWGLRSFQYCFGQIREQCETIREHQKQRPKNPSPNRQTPKPDPSTHRPDLALPRNPRRET